MKNIFVCRILIGVCTYFLTQSVMGMEEEYFDTSPRRIEHVGKICRELNSRRGYPLTDANETELILRAKRGDEDAFYIFCEWNFQEKPQIVNTTIRDLTWDGNEVAFRFYAFSLTCGRYAYGINPAHVRFRIEGVLDGSYSPLAQYPKVVREAERLKAEGLRTGKYGYLLDKKESAQFTSKT